MPLHYAPPCRKCHQLYLEGTRTTCRSCLRNSKKSFPRFRHAALKCDCGELAVAVIRVTIGREDHYSEERIALCQDCLDIEKETQELLDSIQHK